MKKILITVVLSALALGCLGAEESGQSWSRLYRRLSDIDQKYAVMQNITPLDDRTLEPFFYEALNDLVYGDLSQYRQSKETYDDWEILTRTIVRELGEIKGQTASGIIWDVARTAEVPLLKAEAVISLGQMRATEYAEDIALMLRNLNYNIRSDVEAAEIEAFGAVVCLDKMKDEAGFEPLFYASIGWYTDRVTSLADEAVLSLTDNPLPFLTTIMEDAADYNHKLAALNVSLRTDATAGEKSSVAVTALSEGLKYAENDYTLLRQLANLRIEAMNALLSFGVSGEDAPRLLNEAADEGDMDELLLAVQALGADGGDAATGYLVNRLDAFNERQGAGLAINRDELIVVRQLIFALGETGNVAAIEVLTQMAYLDYTPALVRDSKAAIAKINGE